MAEGRHSADAIVWRSIKRIHADARSRGARVMRTAVDGRQGARLTALGYWTIGTKFLGLVEAAIGEI